MIWYTLLLVIFLIALSIYSFKQKEKNDTKKYITLNTKGKDSLVFELAGVHVNKEFIMNFCKKGDVVTLEYEPSNKFDKDAIKVMHGKYKIGYVPSIEIKDVNEFISKYNYISFIYLKENFDGFLSVEIGLVEN